MAISTVKPVSNAALIARLAYSKGILTVGEFIVFMALRHVALTRADLRAVVRVYAEHQTAHEPLNILTRRLN